MKRFAASCALFTTVLLSACGGGGGSGSEPNANANATSTQTFQFKSAWASYLRQGFTKSFTISGTASNPSVGSFPVTGSGNVTQLSTEGVSYTPAGAAVPVTAIKVERTYLLNATVNGLAVPQRLTDVAYYDSGDYHYLGGTSTDNTGTTVNNLLASWSPVPETLKCCESVASPFYSTTAVANGPLTHQVTIRPDQDRADSIFVYMGDVGSTQHNRTYRLSGAGLAPYFESLNAVATVLTTTGTYTFNVAVQFLY